MISNNLLVNVLFIKRIMDNCIKLKISKGLDVGYCSWFQCVIGCDEIEGYVQLIKEKLLLIIIF